LKEAWLLWLLITKKRWKLPLDILLNFAALELQIHAFSILGFG